MLMDFQRDLADFLIADPTAQSPAAGLLSEHSHDQLSVYRNNFMSATVDAIKSSYPAIVRLVGEAFFDAMAAAYVRQNPPRHRSLVGYGADLGAFIAQFEPAASLPYLPDIAALEAAWLNVNTAQDWAPLTPLELSDKSPDDLNTFAPGLLPAAQLVPTRWSVYDIWTDNRWADGQAGYQALQKDQFILIVRPEMDVLHKAISAVEARFLRHIGEGDTLMKSLSQTVEYFPEINAAGLIATILELKTLRGTQ